MTDQEAVFEYPSMAGTNEVQVARQPDENLPYKNTPSGADSVELKDLSELIGNRVLEAHRREKLHSTLPHLVTELRPHLDSRDMAILEAFSIQAGQHKWDRGFNDILVKRVNEWLTGLKPVRRK